MVHDGSPRRAPTRRAQGRRLPGHRALWTSLRGATVVHPIPRPRAERRRRPVARSGPVLAAWGLLSSCATAVAAGLAPVLMPLVSAVLLVLVVVAALRRSWFLLLDAGLLAAVITFGLTVRERPGWSGLSIGLVTTVAVGLGPVLRRGRTGAAYWSGRADATDAMLTDLQNRVLQRSATPALPVGWQLDTDLRAAHGASFSGDFVVTGASIPDRLDVVLADVSGQGLVAGGRALMLAAAIEALLEVVPRDEFLAAANQHVVRHGDDDHFATAVRVSVDLRTGQFVVGGAGHPPVAHYRAGSGRWTVLDDEQGPALGLLADARYPATSGVLGPGDALLLYTDGLVENRGLDVWRGIDRLIGHADALIAKGLAAVAAPIAEAIRAEEGDDRALVVIRRG